ncbi:hypothetical protein LUZ60_011640 [Juncus effusus]|nr:hypothetical protein LUZ60_011640 [Juncus effusus]
MGLQEEFTEYTSKATELPLDTSDEDKLILYGLYKQATIGSVNIPRPGKFNTTGRYKWDFWKANEGKTKEEAMTEYIDKVKELQEAATS